jgi:hypothetical protein
MRRVREAHAATPTVAPLLLDDVPAARLLAAAPRVYPGAADAGDAARRGVTTHLMKARWIVVVAFGMAFAVVAPIWCWGGNTAAQTWTVILTGLILLWYTWETSELRRAAVLQTQVQLRPFVVLELWSPSFRLLNFGTHPALNVTVDPVTIEAPGSQIEVRFPARLAVLPPGGGWIIPTESWKNGVHLAHDIFSAHLQSAVTEQRLTATVRYQDIEGRSYSVAVAVAPGIVEIGAVKASIPTRDWP